MFLNVLDFGVVGDGATDDRAAIQAVLNTGKSVFFPRKVYYISGPIVTAADGQVLLGENRIETYFTTPQSGAGIDIIRVQHAYCDISGFNFRPSKSTDVPIRVYAARLHLHGNRFLSNVNGAGTAIILTDVNPSGGNVGGAYTHIIENNEIGYDGFEFAKGIDCIAPTNGIQACKIHKNIITSNAAVTLEYGGGNSYFGNLVVSGTGTPASPQGIGFDFGARVVSEHVSHNYFEKLAQPVVTRRSTNAERIVTATSNGYDFCGTNKVVATAGGTNFIDDNASAAPVGRTLITGGTLIGDMVGGGGLAGLFDGVTSKTFNNSSHKATVVPNSAFAGKQFAAATMVSGYTVHGSSDYGYDSTLSTIGVGQTTVSLRGSNNGTTWTTLHTQTFADNNTTNPKDVTLASSASFTHYAVFISNSHTSVLYPCMAQIQFWS